MRSMQPATFCLSLLAGVFSMLLVCTAAQGEVSDRLDMEGAGGMAGITVYSPDQWGLVRTTVANRGSEARSPLVVHALGERRHIQYAHRLWLPGNSRRTQLTPVLPLEGPRDDRAFALRTWMIEDADGRERSGPPSEGLLLAARGTFQMGVMLDRDDASAGDAAAALRAAAGHGVGASYLGDSAAPALPAAWDVLDAFVLGRTPDLNAAQVDAMRRWVFGGGRLWVMLDKVDPAFVERLLGDAWDVSVADRIWLDELSMEDVETGDVHEVIDEAGTQMLRVHAPGMRVTHEVAGYPAAAWQRVGRGKVMMTTAHAKAFIEPGVDEEGVEVKVAAAPLQSLTWFFDEHRHLAADENALVHETMDGQSRAQIGYSIISRTPVFAVLAVFTLALLGVGVMLLRRDRLEWIGVVGVVFAVATSAVLVGMGKMRQSDHAMTLAGADLVEPVRDQPYASVRGSFSVFRPDHAAGQVTFAGPGDAIAFPKDARRTSERVRIVWQGLDRWSFENLSLPAGAARNFSHDRVVTLDRPMSASARLTAEGLAGEVQGHGGATLSDALIAMPNGRLATRVSSDGRFASSLDDRLIGEQYVHAATLGTLSQTQMNRQQAFRQLLGSAEFPAQPTLLAWVDAQDLAVEMSADAVRRGQWLLALPLQIELPASGERVTVPAPMMTIRSYRGAPGVSGATVYDEQQGEWIYPISQPSTLFMRFEPPEGLDAIDVDGAVLSLNLHAPGWEYEVLRIHDGEVEVVYEGRNPGGRLSIELDADQSPAMNTDGAAAIGIRLSPIPGSDGGRGWSLQRMELSLRGVVR
ncbi:hypothetical protein ACERK3_14200 [Phycisphaerales bacterium AB-hyl4]|uniref:Uncharacterized protein n=1 Tax=Natronomicrosphaera hydrolytica TaxID=3242702 RepID=A0ABV4U825_9BACT